MRKKGEMLFYAKRVMSKKNKSWTFNIKNMPVICLADTVTIDLEGIREQLRAMPDDMAFIIGRQHEDESYPKDFPIPSRSDSSVSKLHCFIIKVKNSDEFYQLFDVSKNGTSMISEHCRSYKGYTKSVRQALQIFI